MQFVCVVVTAGESVSRSLPKGKEAFEPKAVYEITACIAVVDQSAIDKLAESLVLDRDSLGVMVTLPEAKVAETIKFLQSRLLGNSFHSRPSIRTLSGESAEIKLSLEVPQVVPAGNTMTAVEIRLIEALMNVDVERIAEDVVSMDWEVNRRLIYSQNEGAHLHTNDGVGGTAKLEAGEAVLFAREMILAGPSSWLVTVLQPTLVEDSPADSDSTRMLRHDIQELHHDVRELIELLRERRPAESKLENTEAGQAASEEVGPKLLFFTASYAPPCQKMEPIVRTMAREFEFIERVDITEKPKIARQHRVSRIPTFILIKDGVEKKRLTGLRTADELRALVFKVYAMQQMPRAAGASVEFWREGVLPSWWPLPWGQSTDDAGSKQGTK